MSNLDDFNDGWTDGWSGVDQKIGRSSSYKLAFSAAVKAKREYDGK